MPSRSRIWKLAGATDVFRFLFTALIYVSFAQAAAAESPVAQYTVDEAFQIFVDRAANIDSATKDEATTHPPLIKWQQPVIVGIIAEGEDGDTIKQDILEPALANIASATSIRFAVAEEPNIANLLIIVGINPDQDLQKADAIVSNWQGWSSEEFGAVRESVVRTKQWCYRDVYYTDGAIQNAWIFAPPVASGADRSRFCLITTLRTVLGLIGKGRGSPERANGRVEDLSISSEDLVALSILYDQEVSSKSSLAEIRLRIGAIREARE